MASAIPSLLFCLILAAAHLGSSYHTSYTNGGKHFVVLSSDPRSPSTCSPVPSDGGRLPVMHRLSPCAPASGAGAGSGQSMPSIGDALRLRALFGDSGDYKKSGLTIPSIGTPLQSLPGASEYHVTVGYGTPILCGSRKCPLSDCSGPSCTATLTKKGAVVLNATFVTDTLTVSRSVAVDDFRFVCLETRGASTVGSSSGVLDLSRDPQSLASRVVLSPDTVAFSYCLPSAFPYSAGFLSFGATRPNIVSYATLKSKASHPNLYFLRLVGVSVGGVDIPVPPQALAGDALMELHTTFTYLQPKVYAALRDQFRGWMGQYPVAPPYGELDTCYNFTGQSSVGVPAVELTFEGGAGLEPGVQQTMYFKDRGNIFPVGCLAFAPVPAHARGISVIGTLAQATTEVVYDLRGGKVGFVPKSCL
ncbi:aspartyl protease family protein At5g10770-like [Triticum dicoccoides]|uniref:aspartyl protease family protein At5g10770-like n=1 Tax=Triticum dicoccoides TaxID=85692 RepID=UPI00189108B4|nr:aspartyl protease family protein At5g10770-like [Triticum dicoccoides]XP_044428175.1 aspartyl protease family protein At5g10770-like [Triticum aestivum]